MCPWHLNVDFFSSFGEMVIVQGIIFPQGDRSPFSQKLCFRQIQHDLSRGKNAQKGSLIFGRFLWLWQVAALVVHSVRCHVLAAASTLQQLKRHAGLTKRVRQGKKSHWLLMQGNSLQVASVGCCSADSALPA